MLILSGGREVAHGNDRRVFIHPHYPDRCIKVARFPERGSYQNTREKRYFEGLGRRHLASWDNVSEYFGTVETDLGEGLVFALITDADGEISQTLRQYRERAGTTWLAESILSGEFQKLYRFLHQHWIVPSDINDRNVVCQRRADGSLRFWLIDGVSNPDMLPLASIWPWFARRKIDRRMKRFGKKLERYGFVFDSGLSASG